jgi:hypothetical protein
LTNIFFYGVKLYSNEISTTKTKEEILSFISENITSYKIIRGNIFLRRRYLKWIQWATPIPLEVRIKIKELDNSIKLHVEMRTLLFPWMLLGYSILLRYVYSTIPIMNLILILVFAIIFIYMFGLLEKIALLKKIKKFSNLDKSYSMFA